MEFNENIQIDYHVGKPKLPFSNFLGFFFQLLQSEINKRELFDEIIIPVAFTIHVGENLSHTILSDKDHTFRSSRDIQNMVKSVFLDDELSIHGIQIKKGSIIIEGIVTATSAWINHNITPTNIMLGYTAIAQYKDIKESVKLLKNDVKKTSIQATKLLQKQIVEILQKIKSKEKEKTRIKE